MTTPHTAGTPYLVALDPGPGKGRLIPLTRDRLVVGRAMTSDVRFDDAHVSRTHAELRREAGHVWVQDLGSSAGTRVNGHVLSAAVELKPGDVLSFATVQVRYSSDQVGGEETSALPRQGTRAVSEPTLEAAPPARYDIDKQIGGSISNVARDQYLSYVQQVTQQRQSFLREVAATRTKARWLVWTGFALSVVGFGLFAAGVLGFIAQASDGIETGDISPPVDPFGRDIAGIPSGLLGWALAALGGLLLLVGIVLHIVATSRRRRVDRELPAPPPPWQVPGQSGG